MPAFILIVFIFLVLTVSTSLVIWAICDLLFKVGTTAESHHPDDRHHYHSHHHH